MKGLPKFAEQAQAQEQVSQRKEDVDSEATSSMMGPVFDRFLRNSSAKQYLNDRESIGSGILYYTTLFVAANPILLNVSDCFFSCLYLWILVTAIYAVSEYLWLPSML